jgi:hypothetical protein
MFPVFSVLFPVYSELKRGKQRMFPVFYDLRPSQGMEGGEDTLECLDLPGTRRTVRTSLIIKTFRRSQSVRPTGNVGTTVR